MQYTNERDGTDSQVGKLSIETPVVPSPENRPTDTKKIDNDRRIADNNSLTSHNEEYDKILKIYAQALTDNLMAKQEQKNEFYSLSKRILESITIVFVCIVVLGSVNALSDNSFSVMVTALGGFLTTYIVIPHTITKYLFNEKEEKHIAKIIENIQNYDSKIREGLDGKTTQTKEEKEQ